MHYYRPGEREYVRVCVCVCVCEREREREREMFYKIRRIRGLVDPQSWPLSQSIRL